MRLTFIALALAAAACDPYSPDLGERPFSCDPQDPVCPEGYIPVTIGGPPYCVCERGEEPEPADAGTNADGNGMFQCNPDPLEAGGGNDSINTATPTAIGPGASSSVFNDLAICPAADRDTFSMNIIQANMTVEVRVQFDPAIGALGLDILNSAGSTVATGTIQTNQLRATLTVPASGTYYAQVKSGGPGVQNNYDIQMQATAP